MGRSLSCALVVLILASGPGGVLADRSADGGAAGRTPEEPDWDWTGEARLTDDFCDDVDPELAVDGAGNVSVAWNRTGGQGTFMWKKVGTTGNRLVAERPVGGWISRQRTGQPSPSLGLERSGRVRLLSQNGSGHFLSCLDSDGKDLGGPVRVAPGASDIPAACLAAGTNGRTYIAYANGSSNLTEMVYYDGDKLATGPFAAGNGTGGVTMALDCWNSPHLFFQDDAGSVLYFTEFSPDGELVHSPTALDTGSVCSGPDRPMPRVVIGADGAIHLLLANVTDGKRSLHYFKMDREGRRLAGDIVITRTAADFGDLVVDSFNDPMLVWGDTRDGEIHYMWMHGGKENATREDRILSNSSGKARSPRICIDTHWMRHVVWSDDRFGNFELYYTCNLMYRLEASLAPAEAGKMMSIHPNQNASANLTVRNVGSGDETAKLALWVDFHNMSGGVGKDYSGDGWKVWLDSKYLTLELAPQKAREVPVHVRAPAIGTAGDHIDVLVNVTPRTWGWPLVNESFRAYLGMDHGIRLHFTEHVHGSGAGVPTIFSMDIQNLGGFEEVVELSAEGTPGWEWKLWRTQVRLGPRRESWLALEVTPPDDAYADEVGIVTVTARIAEEPAVSDTVQAWTVVSPWMELGISPDRTVGMAGPGGSASYVITVRNRGNHGEPVPILLEASADRKGWVASLDASSIPLAGGQSGAVVLTVGAPEDAFAGECSKVTVTCQNGPGTLRAGCAVVTRAELVQGLTVSVFPAGASLDPGGKAGFRIDVANAGNGYETFRAERPGLPPGWDIEFLDGYGAIVTGEVALPPHGRTWLEAVVTADNTGPAGTRRIDGRVVDGVGNGYPYGVDLSLNRVSGMELGAPSPVECGAPGARVLFPLDGTNLGNGNEELRFSASVLPEGWPAAEFRDAGNVINDRLELEAFGSGRMYVAVRIPEFTPADSAQFTVTATSGAGAGATATLTVKVQKPELRITAVEPLLPKASPGKPVLVRVSVRNCGDALASNVTVAFRYNGVLLTEVMLGPMASGDIILALFEWVPAIGDNTLRFVVDPNDAVCERNETNNEATFQKRVDAGKVTISPDRSTNVAMALVVLVAVAGLAMVLGKRRS